MSVVWWLSVAATVIVAVLLIVLAAHAASGGAVSLDFYFRLPTSAYHISSSQLSRSAAHVALSSGQLSFAHPRASFVLVGALILGVSAAGWLFVVHQLRGMLASLRDGRTFAEQNAGRLRRIGFAVIVFELARSVAVWVGALYLKHVLIVRGLRLATHFSVNLPVVLLGLLLLVIAVAFRVGSELAAEQALTI
ncbi:MAG: DUF2975 domain-containing protein [Solirubrobacteraceae bacterium]